MFGVTKQDYAYQGVLVDLRILDFVICCGIGQHVIVRSQENKFTSSHHIFLSFLKFHSLCSGRRSVGNSWILYFDFGLFSFCVFDFPRDGGLFHSLLYIT